MYNVYGVDMADGTLYYIRDGIWSIEGEKVTYIANTGEEKQGYVVETINGQYLEDRKFITEWTVEAGNTITLPINAVPNVTIEWGADDDGDGQLDLETCTTTKPTHTYTNAGTYTIKISGQMPSWSFESVNLSKDYITRIVQWGNVRIQSMSFNNCGNLAGTIPSHKTEGEFAELTNINTIFYNCKKLIGSIPSDFFEDTSKLTSIVHCFSGCTGLTGEIPEKLLEECINLTNIDCVFYNCTGLTGEIPAKLFEKNIKITRIYGVFMGCTGLTGEIPSGLFDTNTKAMYFTNCFNGCTNITGKIPDGLFKNCPNVLDMGAVFRDTSITEIPASLFDVNNGQPNRIKNIAGGFQGTKITTIPAGLFDLCTEVEEFGTTTQSTWYNGTFQECTLLETIPENLFYNNTKVTTFGNVFKDCTSLKIIPENTFNTSAENVNLYGAFYGCTSLTEIKAKAFNIPNISSIKQAFWKCGALEKIEEGFIIPQTVNYMESAFLGCFKLSTTITLKSNQATYNNLTFNHLNSNSCLNWAEPCTEERVTEMLTAMGRMDLLGEDVTEK